MTTFEPTTTAAQMVEWLTLADRLQLDRDLHDLPTLAELLERNYFHLLAKGDRDPRDSAVRYITKFDVLDLADRRFKPAYIAADPEVEADTARRMGARRQGILPTLASWVGLAVEEMHLLGVWHRTPTDPDQIVWVVGSDGIAHPTKPGPSVASEAGWLACHLDWITGQQWVVELAAEVRRIVLDLEALGVGDAVPDRFVIGTVGELAEWTGVPAATIYRWAGSGYLTEVSEKRPKTYMRTEVLALRKTTN